MIRVKNKCTFTKGFVTVMSLGMAYRLVVYLILRFKSRTVQYAFRDQTNRFERKDKSFYSGDLTLNLIWAIILILITFLPLGYVQIESMKHFR